MHAGLPSCQVTIRVDQSHLDSPPAEEARPKSRSATPPARAVAPAGTFMVGFAQSPLRLAAHFEAGSKQS